MDKVLLSADEVTVDGKGAVEYRWEIDCDCWCDTVNDAIDDTWMLITIRIHDYYHGIKVNMTLYRWLTTNTMMMIAMMMIDSRLILFLLALVALVAPWLPVVSSTQCVSHQQSHSITHLQSTVLFHINSRIIVVCICIYKDRISYRF